MRTWNVTIDEQAPGFWSIYGAKTDGSGDAQGTNVVGDEQAARDCAAELFGADATVTVTLAKP